MINKRVAKDVPTIGLFDIRVLKRILSSDIKRGDLARIIYTALGYTMTGETS
ncbi:MAG: hypothetical protein KUG82_15655 [Pseudomonadales bacterium]|nr:hypothetical protein [Pseudomonadales bacterium]